jgi:hypothetical protein
MVRTASFIFWRVIAGWPAILRWSIAVMILGSTYVLVLTKGLQPHEWAEAVTFIVAHILAAKVILAGD